MKIRRIAIQNFRGVKEFDWSLPDRGLFCLIGKGDSSKSTILDAIRCAFHPHWSLVFTDSDFYQCSVANPIVIEVTFGSLTQELRSLAKYGYLLRGWDAANMQLTDEPDDHLESVLTMRLTVADDLEPKWVVLCDRNPEGVKFHHNDRNKVSVGLIGAYSEKQLTWATGTALAKLTEAQSLNELLANTSRTARASLDADRPDTLKNFDAAADKAQTLAQQLGVPVRDAYKAHLDLASINLKVGGLSLHDGDMPLRQLGLGSRRMLLCGIQKMGLEDAHITLFDEVEYGLEPHRITRLIKHVKDDKRGQYFLTTHSPVVLRELTIDELHIVHSKDGVVTIVPAAKEGLEELEVQGKIRSSAEAFLSKRVIVCEGATEVGFLRGLDDHQVAEKRDPLSFHGVALLDAKGASKVKALAIAFEALGYEVAVLADADAPDQLSQADIVELGALGVSTHIWEDKLSLEERAFKDLPWPRVLDSLRLAEEHGYPVYDQVRARFQDALDQDVGLWLDSAKLRSAIGAAAKAKSGGWFKDTTRGDLWFKAISSAYQDAKFVRTNLVVELGKLWTWVEHV